MRFWELLLEDEAPPAKKVGREFNHLEDLVFTETNGAQRAIQILKDLAKPESKISIKWDGNPTIYWGRDDDGTFERNSSGDLDLSVDANEVDKRTFADKLISQFGKENIKLSGDNVHWKVPINGDSDNGFVQADFMFSANPKFQQGSMIAGGGEYRGEHRHIILSSIARAKNMKYSPKHGILNPQTDELLPNGNDWNQIAKELLGQTATIKDIRSVDAILNYIKKLPNYEELVAGARETLGRQGIELPRANQIESYQPGTIGWMRQLIEIVK